MKCFFKGRPATKRSLVLLAVVVLSAAAILMFPSFSPSHFSSQSDTPVFVPLTASGAVSGVGAGDTIIVRGDWGYPPFEFVDESGEAAGFNVDILTRIAEVMNLDVQISLGPWHEVRKELEEGKIDVLAGMYKTAERDRQFDFSVPHFIASYGVFVMDDSKIREVEDIANRRILVQLGDLGHDFLIENQIGAEIVTVPQWESLLPALRDGDGDCVVMGMVQGMRLLREHGYSDIRLLSGPLLQRPYSIAVQKGNAELLSILNEGLNLLKVSGEYDEIHERWFGVYDDLDPFGRSIIRVLAGGTLALSLVLILILLWSYSLRKQVRRQTANLDTAMADLKQANDAKDRFLASVSHELRTPLHGIIGMADLMEKTGLDSGQSELLEMMKNASSQLHRLLSDLLDTSLMSAGRLSLRESLFSLSDLADWLDPVLRAKAEAKGLKMIFTLSGKQDAVLRSDRERIAQIIINLTDNAIKNTDRGEVNVRVSYGAEGHGTLEIVVCDTGRGIPKEEQDEIFAPFRQVNSGTAAFASGLGLGLSIVTSITELLGGSVDVRSNPGEGSRFSVRVPVEETYALPSEVTLNPPTRISPAEPPADVSTDHNSRSDAKEVLVAEDEAINRLYLQRLLEVRGWAVTLVGDGEDALNAFGPRTFDLILTDVSMPKLGGLDVAKRVRGIEAETGRRRTPIIALTAHADDASKQKCADAGMDGFVSKPFGESAVWTEVDRVLSARN